MSKNHDFLGTMEVSKLLGVTRATLKKWVDQKKINAYITPGGTTRMLRTDVLAYMKKNSIKIPAKYKGIDVAEIESLKDLISDLKVVVFELTEVLKILRTHFSAV